MTIDDAKTLWHLQESQTEWTVPEQQILETVRRRTSDRDRILRRRDRRETWAAALVACFFGLAGVVLLIAGLYLSSLGASIVVVASAWIAWKLNSTRKRYATSPPAQPLLDAIAHELDKVEAQIDLLRTVFWWYILPLAGGALTMLLGLPGMEDRALIYTLVAAVLSAAVYGLNQYAVRTELVPRRDDLNALLLQAADAAEEKHDASEDNR